MRPIWKGHISFGLVTIRVTLYPAEERAELRLLMVDSRNHARVEGWSLRRASPHKEFGHAQVLVEEG